VAGQVVVVGYGSKGRAVIRALSESGVQKAAIVVIDSSAEAVAEVNAAGLVAVGGDRGEGDRRSTGSWPRPGPG
jgi:voltage-gated potassium channel